MLCGFELLTLSGGVTLGSIGSIGLLDRLEDELLDGCGVEFVLLTSSTSSLSSSMLSLLSLLTSLPKPKNSFNLLKSLNKASRAFASSIICDFCCGVSDDLEVLLLMLLGKPLGIELGGDGSDDDEILFCFNIYLNVCVILFLLSFNNVL